MNTNIKNAEIIMPCIEFDATLNFFVDRLGFRIDSIFPADNPRVAVISAYGLSIRLEASETENNENLKIRLNHDSPETITNGETSLVAPNGVTIEFADSDLPLEIPDLEPSLVINKLSENADWIEGRAGMRYRDLIPGRQGGYIIASHIHIPDAGPVPDYVHFHKVAFQMIYCYKGWVRVVYEDQGEPFVLNAGDCVLQPPEIRHRVLECSENLEVIEISSPAEHITYADHEMELPNGNIDVEREFNGQRFVRHIAAEADWKPWRASGFECRDTGIGEAARGLANVEVVRANSTNKQETLDPDVEFLFMFVLEGNLSLGIGNKTSHLLAAGDSFVIPFESESTLFNCSIDLRVLHVSLPKI